MRERKREREAAHPLILYRGRILSLPNRRVLGSYGRELTGGVFDVVSFDIQVSLGKMMEKGGSKEERRDPTNFSIPLPSELREKLTRCRAGTQQRQRKRKTRNKNIGRSPWQAFSPKETLIDPGIGMRRDFLRRFLRRRAEIKISVDRD